MQHLKIYAVSHHDLNIILKPVATAVLCNVVLWQSALKLLCPAAVIVLHLLNADYGCEFTDCPLVWLAAQIYMGVIAVLYNHKLL